MTDWRERLRRAAQQHSARAHRKQAAIAQDAGIAPATLSRILNGQHAHPLFETVVRIGYLVGEEPLSVHEQAALRATLTTMCETAAAVVQQLDGLPRARVHLAPEDRARIRQIFLAPREYSVAEAARVLKMRQDALTPEAIEQWCLSVLRSSDPPFLRLAWATVAALALKQWPSEAIYDALADDADRVLPKLLREETLTVRLPAYLLRLLEYLAMQDGVRVSEYLRRELHDTFAGSTSHDQASSRRFPVFGRRTSSRTARKSARKGSAETAAAIRRHAARPRTAGQCSRYLPACLGARDDLPPPATAQ